ncbi:hypothetical protein RV18_GL001587 [Enterococcus termitis]|nr:hypothetical protein RV18_GL001587 [Enterococcus termitis]
MIDMKEKENGDLGNPIKLRNLSTLFLESIDSNKDNAEEIYAVSDALIDLAKKIEKNNQVK